MDKLDIIIPILNEEENLSRLVKRIDSSFKKAKINYRIIAIDDKSSDNSLQVLKELSKNYPITYRLKKGKIGKAYSIIEGCKISKSKYVAMLDADLQYPPESIPEMYNLAKKDGLGIVLGNRIYGDIGKIRSIVSKASRLIVGRLVAGLSCDTQTGLKIFKKEIVDHMDVKNVYPWAFDVPLIHTAKELGFGIGAVNIHFSPRSFGNAKMNLIKGTLQILSGAIKQRFSSKKVYHFKPGNNSNMLGAGVIYKKNKFLTHTTLNHKNSAIVTFTRMQKLIILSFFIITSLFLVFYTKNTLIVGVGVLSAIYFIDVLFNLYLVLKSLHFPPELHFEDSELEKIDDSLLPKYTILCPLYKEATVLPQFVKSINNLDYPKDKLEVLLLLEEDDTTTIAKAKELNLDNHFKVLVVPHSLPKTKPKACNYGLAHATGEYLVIYDAEDIPDAKQLKKAVLGFNKLGDGYVCLQAKLNYHNPNQNWLTRLFTAEYSLWFDVMLPALQTVDTFIPLGGTSNHFRNSSLVQFEGWDPFNVTEDADLGVRLFRAGGKTAIIDSITYEEANSNLKNWIRQRSRWIKGYLQTYLVHMRNPIDLAKKFRSHFLIFQLVAGLRMTFMIINPILWVLTISYFVLYSYVGPQIESLYPASVFYMAITSAVFGNFLYIYYYMIGTAKHGQYQLIKYIFLIPIYWLFTSIAACVAFWQLLVKPHYWEKTIHGLVKKQNKRQLFNFEFAGLREFGFKSINKIKSFSTSSLAGGAFLIFASMFGNFMNFLYNAYLGRSVSLEDFGVVSLLGSFVFLSQIPLSSLQTAVTHRSAFLLGKYSVAASDFWTFCRSRVIKVSIVVFLIWIAISPFLKGLFNTDQILPFLIFAPTWIIGFAGAVDSGFLRGNMRFVASGFIVIIESTSKLLFSILLVKLGFTDWVYLAIPLSMLSAFLIGWFISKKIKQHVDLDVKVVKYFPFKFLGMSMLTKISSMVFLSFDLILVKIFLSPTQAGLYALLSLTGKMVYMIGGQFSKFILPVVSKSEGENKDSTVAFYKLMVATLIVSVLAYLGIGQFGFYTAPLLFGEKVIQIIPYLRIFAFSMVLQNLVQNVVDFHLSKNNNIFPIANFAVSITSILGIVIFHNDISVIVNVLFISSVASTVAVVALHFYYYRVEIFFRNILDFLGVFKKIPNLNYINTSKSLRILIFNWRDTKHIWSGGAEVYIHEIAKRLVKKGNSVTLFCGNDGKSPRNEVIDGVQMIRRGGFYTVFIWAFLYYIFRLRNYFDIIIDSENGIPFFTPIYAKQKIFLLIHHVHQDVFRIKLKPPLSWIGKFLEKEIMPMVYKNTEVLTVSPSSKADILEHKISSHDPHIIYNGVDADVYKPGVKSKIPMVLYLGRLSTQKSLKIFILTAKKIIKKIPLIKFVIAGDGDERKRLIELVNKLKLESYFTFTGKVSQKEKVNLYQKAWVFINPSLMEGWGITTIEANACGVPVVASNVAGLRDSVHNPHSGFLVPYGDVDEFSKHVIKLIKNDRLRNQMSNEALVWSKTFSWDKSTDEIARIFNITNEYE